MTRYKALIYEMFERVAVDPARYFSDDAEFHMHEGVSYGPEAIRHAITKDAHRYSDFRIEELGYAEVGNKIFFERIDHVVFDGTKRVALPILSSAIVGEDGRFTFWKDYFDVVAFQQLM